MKGEQKDLTRAQALMLAEQNWGKEASVRYGIHGYRVGYFVDVGSDMTEFVVKGRSIRSWREACDRAGLLSKEGASR